jgi:hypothetical protein
VHPLLESAYAKLARASEHLHELKTKCAEYTLGEPRGVAADYEANIREEGNRPGVAVRVQLDTSPPPAIALIAGDAVQNARNALDHVAHAIVLRNRSVPDTATQFPILDDRLGLNGGIKDVTLNPRASQLANSIIERLQPYHRLDDPTKHPLAVLRDLSNIDKHRHLHVIAGYAGNIRVSVETAFYTVRITGEGLAESGTLLTVVPPMVATDPSLLKIEMEHSVEVGLREFRVEPPSPLDDLLEELLIFVREDVVDRLCRRVFRSQPPPRTLF